MNVHSLSTVGFAPPRDLIGPRCHKPNSAVCHGPVGRRRRSYLTGHRPVATTAAEIFLRFRIHHCFHGVMRHNGHTSRWRLEASERIWRRLPDELHDRGDHAQNARGINRSFHYAPALLFRLYQEPVDRFSFVVHNFKTPRSSRFV